MIEVVKGGIGIIISPDKLDEYIKKGFVRVGEETVKENVDEVKEDMTKYTVKELKAMCKASGMKNYSRLREFELIEKLSEVKQ